MLYNAIAMIKPSLYESKNPVIIGELIPPILFRIFEIARPSPLVSVGKDSDAMVRSALYPRKINKNIGPVKAAIYINITIHRFVGK